MVDAHGATEHERAHHRLAQRARLEQLFAVLMLVRGQALEVQRKDDVGEGNGGLIIVADRL